MGGGRQVEREEDESKEPGTTPSLEIAPTTAITETAAPPRSASCAISVSLHGNLCSQEHVAPYSVCDLGAAGPRFPARLWLPFYHVATLD